MSTKTLLFELFGIDRTASEAFGKVSKAANDASVNLGGFGKVGLATLAGFPLAAGAAGAAIGGSMALVSAGVVGVAAVVLRKNTEVAASAAALAANLTSTMHAAAAPLADEFRVALGKISNAVTEMAPQLTSLFTAAKPAVDDLTTGVIMFARNAMPGLITAVQSSGAPLQGLKSLMADTGTGITAFFTNAAAGAESSGQIIGTFGTIVKDVMGFAGSLLASVANTGAPAFATLAAVMRQAEATILSLAQGALPVLSAASSGFLAAGGGVLRLLQLVAPVLGPLTGQVISFAASLKLVDMVTFGGVANGLGTVKTAMSEAEGTGGKLKAGFGALAGSSLPGLGLAAIALSFLLQDLGKAQREAATAAALHDKTVRDLAKDVDDTTGAINAQGRADIANKVAKDNIGAANTTLAVSAQRVGVTTNQVTDAILGQNGQLGTLDTSMRNSVKSNILAADSHGSLQAIMKKTGLSLEDLTTIYMGGAGGVDAFQERLNALDIAMETGHSYFHDFGQSVQASTLDTRNLWGGISELAGGLTEAQKQALQAAQAINAMTPAQKAAQANAEALRGDFKTLADAMKTVADKGKAITDALDRIQGKKPDLRATQQAWDDLARSLAKDTDWNTAQDGVQKLSNALVDMRGEVNTTTEAGSKLREFAQQSGQDFANQGIAMAAAGIPADQMISKMGVMRQSFIDNAVAQGLSRDAAERLANTYHLVPADVTTLILAPNLYQKMAEMGIFANQILNLPDGTVEVIANTDPARGSFTKLIQDISGKIVTLRIVGVGDTQTVRNIAGGLPAQAAGGWVTGPGTTTSDSVLTWLSNKEFVVGADKAAKYGPLLEAINSGRPLGMIAGSDMAAGPIPAQTIKHYHLTVHNAGNTVVDLQAQFRRLEQMAGV